MRKTVHITLLIIVLIAGLLLPGCNSRQNNDKESTIKSVQESGVSLNGRTITIFYPGTASLSAFNFAFNESTLKNFAEKMDDKYGCQIKIESNSEYQISQIISDIKAGNFKYDIVSIYGYIFNLANEDIIIPLDEYIDFRSTPFNSPFQEEAQWKGQHYGIYVPITDRLPVDWAANNFITYNKILLSENSIPDIYELQKEGLWTWDKLLEITQKVTQDTDGDGTIDIWGISSYQAANLFERLVYSNGSGFIQDRGNFNLVPNYKSSAVIRAVDFLRKIAIENNVVLFGNDVAGILQNNNSSAVQKELRAMVNDNKIAISLDDYVGTNNLSNFGYAFFPKGPDTDNYNFFAIRSKYYAIPSTAKNPKDVALILKELYQFAVDEREKFMASEDDTRLAATAKNKNQIRLLDESSCNINYLYTDYSGFTDNDVYDLLISNEGEYEEKLDLYEARAQEYLDKLLSNISNN